jgi:5-methylcytosine-specific restriction endonuclease McrA
MRRSLVEPPEYIFHAASRLLEAADHHLNGNFKAAEQLFADANAPAVLAYTDEAWGKGAKAKYAFVTVPGSPPHLPLADRPKPRMPGAAIRRAVVERDGYHCRFCGIPVVDKYIRRRLALRYPKAVPWGSTNQTQHAAFQCMWLQFDHILPNSRGGESTLENIVVACAPCNFGRMQTTLEEARLQHPLETEAPPTWSYHSVWDGLERLRPFL